MRFPPNFEITNNDGIRRVEWVQALFIKLCMGRKKQAVSAGKMSVGAHRKPPL
jgi:hypothetical protein